jgi:hypothetical protein
MLTNKYSLPTPLVNAIRNDPYSKGESDISVTQLIQPLQIRHLSRGMTADEDASEFIWRLLGQAVHTILERAYPETAVVEKRVFSTVRGWVVSGQFDVYEDEVLTDYKITSVYARDGKKEWENQLNLLRALCHRNGMPVSKVQIVAIFRDWRPKEALADDYPASQVAVIPVSLWPIDEAEAYLDERVRLHQMGEPIPCSDEERWMQPSKWALMQKGRKRAVKLFDARPFQIKLNDGQYWELRPGAYRRCESYCRVSSICPQWIAHEAERINANRPAEPEDVADAAGRIETSTVGS